MSFFSFIASIVRLKFDFVIFRVVISIVVFSLLSLEKPICHLTPSVIANVPRDAAGLGYLYFLWLPEWILPARLCLLFFHIMSPRAINKDRPWESPVLLLL
jgi:hypothetical protein